MSLQRSVGGRKRDSLVWRHFKYSEETGKSVCVVAVGVSGKQCGQKLVGKNPTNLKKHLSSTHSELFKLLVADEINRRKLKTRGNSDEDYKRDLTITTFLNKAKLRKPSVEDDALLNSLLKFLIYTGSPLDIVDDPSFQCLLNIADSKLNIPSSITINACLNERWTLLSEKLKGLLSNSRKVTICLDGWTEKGLKYLYLGISVCFYNPTLKRVIHALLNLTLLPRPHTGEAITRCLEECLQEWDIDADKVMLVISDNGSNMIKGITNMREDDNFEAVPSQENWIEMEEEDNDKETESEDYLPLVPTNVIYPRLPCLAHSLRLIAKDVFKSPSHYKLIEKVRYLIKQIHESATLTEKLISNYGMTVIIDCAARWSSTFFMIKRLLLLKNEVDHLSVQMGCYVLLPCEWKKLDEIKTLLEPIQQLADSLHTDSFPLSLLLPSLLNLECHLQNLSSYDSLSPSTLDQFHQQFDVLLNVKSKDFIPIAAAACLLHPIYGTILLDSKRKPLLDAAMTYITNQASCGCYGQEASSIKIEDEHGQHNDSMPPPFKKFKYLFEPKTNISHQHYQPPVVHQMNAYIADIKTFSPTEDDIGLEYWDKRCSSSKLLAMEAEDLLASVASQTSAQRVFSTHGLMITGSRNQMDRSLAMRVWLQKNENLLSI